MQAVATLDLQLMMGYANWKAWRLSRQRLPHRLLRSVKLVVPISEAAKEAEAIEKKRQPLHQGLKTESSEAQRVPKDGKVDLL